MDNILITQLDVGQGDCTIIEVRDVHDVLVRVVVVDCGGGQNGVDHDNSGIKLFNLLQSRGIQHIDIIVISHFERDHFGGIHELLRLANRNNGLVYQNLLQNTVIYDRGQPGIFDNHDGRFNLGGLNNSYTTFVHHIFELNQIRGCNINRITERVHGRTGAQAGNLSVFGTRFSQGNSDPNHRMQVAMEAPNSLIGHDLMNPPGLPPVNAQLICVTVNQYRMNDDNTGTQILNNVHSNDENNESLTVLLRFHNYSHWLSGELAADDEQACIAPLMTLTQGVNLSSMKISHHGSNYSTSDQFLQQTGTAVVLVSCGPNYQHGHPGDLTLNTLNDSREVRKVFLTGYGGPTDHFDYLNYYTPFRRDHKFILGGSDAYNMPGNLSILVDGDQAGGNHPGFTAGCIVQNAAYSWQSPIGHAPPYGLHSLSAKYLFDMEGELIGLPGFNIEVDPNAFVLHVHDHTGLIGHYIPAGNFEEFYF